MSAHGLYIIYVHNGRVLPVCLLMVSILLIVCCILGETGRVDSCW